MSERSGSERPYFLEAEKLLLVDGGGLWRRLRARTPAPEVPELRLALGCSAALDRNTDLWDELEGIKGIYSEVCCEEGASAASQSVVDAQRDLFIAAVEGIAAVLQRLASSAGDGEGRDDECSRGGLSLLQLSSPEVATLVRKAIALESSYVVGEIKALQSAIDRALDDGQVPPPAQRRGAVPDGGAAPFSYPRLAQRGPSKSNLSPRRDGSISKLRLRLSSSLEAAQVAPEGETEGVLPQAPPKGYDDPRGTRSGKVSVFLKSCSTPYLNRDPAFASKGSSPAPGHTSYGTNASSSSASTDTAPLDSVSGKAHQQRTFRNKLRAAKDENFLI